MGRQEASLLPVRRWEKRKVYYSFAPLKPVYLNSVFKLLNAVNSFHTPFLILHNLKNLLKKKQANEHRKIEHTRACQRTLVPQLHLLHDLAKSLNFGLWLHHHKSGKIIATWQGYGEV